MPAETNRVRALLTALSEAGVDFVVCGGLACVLQGVNRVTHDVDLDVALDDANVAKFVGVARVLGLRPRVPEPLDALCSAERRRAWVHEKHAVVFTLVSDAGDLVVDVFLQYPVPHDELSVGATVFNVGGHAIRVSSRAHLIQAKRAVQPPRKQDLRDIEDLLELSDAE